MSVSSIDILKNLDELTEFPELYRDDIENTYEQEAKHEAEENSKSPEQKSYKAQIENADYFEMFLGDLALHIDFQNLIKEAATKRPSQIDCLEFVARLNRVIARERNEAAARHQGDF